VEEIQHRYAQIGGSPLTRLTLQQAALLQRQINLPVYVGMRNWRPYIVDTVRQMRADGITSAVAICLAPQNSRTSVGLYRRAAYAEAGTGADALRIDFIEAWADHPLLAAAFANRLRTTWKAACAEAGRKVPVIFTAHSVPCRTIHTPVQSPAAADRSAGHSPEPVREPVRPVLAERSYALPANAAQGPDPYPVEAKKTASLVAGQLAADGLAGQDWFFAFQSQGASGGPWIGPTVEETMKAVQAEGHAGCILQPIGFLCDHVEVLYDIDIAFAQLAAELGLRLWRPESLNASPLLIDALANLTQQGVARLNAQAPAVATT
jgi:ferrochelatase